MKKMSLLLVSVLLLSCSSNDDNQTSIDAISYQHLIIYVSNNPGMNPDAEIFVKVNHTLGSGNTIEETETFTTNLDKLILVLDNANTPKFTVTNNGATDVIVQFESKRGDGNGGFIQINEANDFFTFETGTTKTVIYDYTKEHYLLQ